MFGDIIVEEPYLLTSPGAMEVHQIVEMKIVLRSVILKYGMIYLAHTAQVNFSSGQWKVKEVIAPLH